jgi:hypothetical protein
MRRFTAWNRTSRCSHPSQLGGKPMASVCHHLLYDGIQWDLMGFTRWLFNIAMEAMAHLQMVYLLEMLIFHGYVK